MRLILIELNLIILMFFILIEAGASEGEDSSCEDSKTASENEASKKARTSEGTEKRLAVVGN